MKIKSVNLGTKCTSFILLFLGTLSLSSCGIQRNLLFQTPTSINPEVFQQSVLSAEKNYVIQKGDYLAISVFPNKGEQIIDQTQDFPIGDNPSQGAARGNQANNNLQLNNDNGNSQLNLPLLQNNNYPNSYLVDEEGKVNLPQLGKVLVEKMTLMQASELLVQKYRTYIKEPYVVMQYLNKRVIVMGALGDQVVPLRNENMSLYEVLALAGGGQQQALNARSVQRDAQARSIRIIRNYQENPSVLIVDLTNIEGIRQLNTAIQPNDIIYLEPRRRFDRDTLSDVNSILAPLASIVALILAINASQ